MGWMAGVQFPAGTQKDFFFLHHHVQTSSETHPASDPMSTGGSFTKDKAVGV